MKFQIDSQIGEIKPKEKELEKIKKETEKIVSILEKTFRKKRVKAEVFVGGSLAKNTIIKKDKYDIDIFVRFDKGEKISDKLQEILKSCKIKAERIHGSRDYFRIKREIISEIIPVIKITKPKEAQNITDLSYFHVSHVLKQIKKNPKLADEIVLAKAFCYFQNVYGAESYIRGFSGYALELLVCHYGSFLNFIRNVVKNKKQMIIDSAKYYKDKEDVMLNLNEAKLSSPIVLVDPTYKERNAAAALSSETFIRFKESCKKFLKKPSAGFFKERKIDKKEFNFILQAETNKQEGDIAGSKLLKFYNFLKKEMERYFSVGKSEFEYRDGKKAVYYFKMERRKQIILEGPNITSLPHLIRFKNKHRNVFIKKGKAYAKENSMSAEKFISEFEKKNKRVMKDMGIVGLKKI